MTPKEMALLVGGRLAVGRKKSGLKLKEIVEIGGFHKNTPKYWETGFIMGPYNTLHKVCAALGVHPDDLMPKDFGVRTERDLAIWIGERIECFIRGSNRSQTEIAKSGAVSATTLSVWKNARVEPFNLPARMAILYGVPLYHLFDLSEHSGKENAHYANWLQEKIDKLKMNRQFAFALNNKRKAWLIEKTIRMYQEELDETK